MPINPANSDGYPPPTQKSAPPSAQNLALRWIEAPLHRCRPGLPAAIAATLTASVNAMYDTEVRHVYDVEPVPASEHAPINSGIPTLVLQGRYDVQTNTEMGRMAM